jgi:oxygen-independent coproporphyrinogen-3 oxidase
MRPAIIKKYNIPVPRYTSFPAVPYWNGAPESDEWIQQLNKKYDPNQGLELYIHVPYCQQLCYYCGCHRVISKNRDRGIEYVEYLLKEWELYKMSFDVSNIKIASIHLGGGTPNFLSVQAMKTLFDELSQYFEKDNFKGSIEIDPRTCETAQLDILKDYGFSRLSMGIQDFDPKVQEAIGRVQSYEKVKALCDYARTIGFDDINFDLIYGLPYQTKATVHRTIEQVLSLSPYQVAFYSYAHLPQKLRNQKLIPEEALPHGAEKRALYENGKTQLSQANYEEIGLDHFALSNSQLSQAKKAGQLRRNFMGHTLKVSPIILGLGVSSISSSTTCFAQNTKSVKEYFSMLDKGILPLEHGHTHSNEDQKIESLLQQFFATERVSRKQWKTLSAYELIEKNLQELNKDQLIHLDQEGFQVTSMGRPFMRNIASVFDSYYQQKGKQKTGSKSL